MGCEKDNLDSDIDQRALALTGEDRMNILIKGASETGITIDVLYDREDVRELMMGREKNFIDALLLLSESQLDLVFDRLIQEPLESQHQSSHPDVAQVACEKLQLK